MLPQQNKQQQQQTNKQWKTEGIIPVLKLVYMIQMFRLHSMRIFTVFFYHYACLFAAFQRKVYYKK